MSGTSATIEKRLDHLQHHFIDSDQQFESAKLGMWIFLATEILFFGGLFAAYIVYRSWYPELYIQASTELNTFWGAINTGVLIGSSLTVAMAIRSAQLNQIKGLIYNLYITIALAFVFMVIKYFEYTHKFHLGIYPGEYYTFEGIAHEKANIFFSIYYMMTGVHGLHVLIGIGLMIWLVFKAKKGAFHSGYYTPVEITGLYWHLVDIIWIFLFPLLYLID
ncbi:cytochrome c oxidase subunit 3 family protein [Rhodohalobacter sulfatireducens]|uniref:Cytochrome c oxidase subunit 3 family protein n=1 Tax=Rhodohalobacter sulfatireducens TaxID=2911366 RepID=A0ABS9KDN2_9BACT|nr:cytochrome c oxidase subunit 3 family protein [Rhodohalobacter sulfatireducens]MCG2588969.1 cytochrome c oxidase subunit 3 family protein [Rhodohalobacter sulfatireducens]MDR9365408.1 cytochrome c oxidase subunit 3 family protein [Balneolaceae bacterium]MDR9407624.1 cytochrome c oxidase subunit 3 family protein [Balneolaceae bacterium]